MGPPATRPCGKRAAPPSLRYCGDDIRFKFRAYAPAQAHFHHTLKDGDPLDCAQFPVGVAAAGKAASRRLTSFPVLGI